MCLLSSIPWCNNIRKQTPSGTKHPCPYTNLDKHIGITDLLNWMETDGEETSEKRAVTLLLNSCTVPSLDILSLSGLVCERKGKITIRGWVSQSFQIVLGHWNVRNHGPNTWSQCYEAFGKLPRLSVWLNHIITTIQSEVPLLDDERFYNSKSFQLKQSLNG